LESRDIAVTLGALCFLLTSLNIWDFIQMERGHAMARPIAVEDKAVLSVLMLIYVLLCVRSFIKARRTPPVQGNGQQPSQLAG
jgi:hypothetical protein